MYSRANRNHFGRLLSFEDQGQHINRDAANKVFNKLHIRGGINDNRSDYFWFKNDNSIIGCGVSACPTGQMAHFCTKINCVKYSFDILIYYGNDKVWAQFENIKCFKNDCNVRKKNVPLNLIFLIKNCFLSILFQVSCQLPKQAFVGRPLR